MPPAQAASGGGRRARPSEELLQDHPWLRDFYPERARVEGGHAGGGGAGPDAVIAPKKDLTDEDIELGWRLLEERRAQWDADASRDEADHFRTCIRGGRAPMMRRHAAYDVIVAEARGGLAREWARQYGVGQIHSFSFARYGEAVACRMALEVCRRLEHYFRIYLEADNDAMVYSEAQQASYEESIDWIDWILGLLDGDAAFDRAVGIRKIVPSHPA